jgi:membrane protein DedA with SNARE-associated domain
LFDPFNNLLENSRAFLAAQPVLFILATGLLIATVSVIGETIVYWAARLGGRSLVFRFSRWLRLDTRHIDRAEALFLRWGIGLVMFGRILPGVRTAVSVPAGVTRMNFALFFSASFGGAYLWNTLLVGLSYLLGIQFTPFGISIL